MCASGKASDLEVEPAGSSNKLETLVIISIELEGPDGGRIPCICLGGTQMQPGDVDGPGCRTDMSRGQVDALRAQMDAPSTLNNAEMDVIGHSEGVGTYLGAGGVKRNPDEPDGCRNLADMSSVHTDAHSDGDELETSANVRINIRTGRIDSKL